jgi:peptidoglycan-associated lipoprotein
MFTRRAAAAAAWLVIVVLTIAGCNRNPAPVARPTPPPGTTAVPGRPPAPPEPVAEPTIVPPEPIPDDRVTSASLDDLNRNSPLKPAFFEYDSAEITPSAQTALDENAAILKKNPSWTITIEGHTDERGTAEYNLALGERRAVAARTYLVSLGVSADRLRTVSYGKEFPFDPANNEAAYAKNRRAHFVITAQ